MSEERRKVLEMLAKGKISAEEAEKLLDATASPPGEPAAPDGKKKRPRWLHIQVASAGCESDQVRIKVPLMLLRTGLKLGSVIPGPVQGKVCAALGAEGIDLDLSKINAEKADELIDALSDMTIDADDGGDRVRIYCA